jgi:hypothetical protein
MLDTDKKLFWAMMNITMELTNHYPLSKEAIIGWWHKLKYYDLAVIQKAVDEWTDASAKTPTPHDIKNLCKPKAEIYTALPAPNNNGINKVFADNVVKFINEHITPKTDYKAWAKRILANPKNFPDSSKTEARDALVNLGKPVKES